MLPQPGAGSIHEDRGRAPTADNELGCELSRAWLPNRSGAGRHCNSGCSRNVHDRHVTSIEQCKVGGWPRRARSITANAACSLIMSLRILPTSL
jgi:hypothetical protein